ncbi:MAG: hypothetical protein NVS1B4_00640 [Gemmatimonadaceae bacterium]
MRGTRRANERAGVVVPEDETTRPDEPERLLGITDNVRICVGAVHENKVEFTLPSTGIDCLTIAENLLDLSFHLGVRIEESRKQGLGQRKSNVSAIVTGVVVVGFPFGGERE